MSERQVCMIGGGMSLWGRRSASLVDVVQEAGKACFDDIPSIKEKTSTDFYLLHLIAAEILFRSMPRR